MIPYFGGIIEIIHIILPRGIKFNTYYIKEFQESRGAETDILNYFWDPDKSPNLCAIYCK